VSQLVCPFCHAPFDNSYQLIEHEEYSCPQRHAVVAGAVEQRPRLRDPLPGEGQWTLVTFRWGNTTYIPLSPTERKVTVQVSNTSFSDSSSGDTGTLTIQDAAGFNVTPATPPTWTADDNGAYIRLQVAADGLSATAAPVAPGTANVTIQVNNADGTNATLQSQVTVTTGDAQNLEVAWSPITPAPQPTPGA
jgi:hypothetical protein